MASTREIKRKIKSVSSTQQITKAMNLVSASKLQRARNLLGETRPFAELTKNVIASIVKGSKGVSHPFLETREPKKALVIAIASDRGLCGGFNSSISKEALALSERGVETEYITVGNRMKDFLVRRGKNVITHYAGESEKPSYTLAAKIGRDAISKYLSKEVDEVYLVYTSFRSTIQYDPTVYKALPVDTSEFLSEEGSKKADDKKVNAQMLFEPSEEEVLDDVIPKYINIAIYGALVESSASQQGARMTAMDTATENAGEMIGKYMLAYNSARQSAITQELTEIIGGANALD